MAYMAMGLFLGALIVYMRLAAPTRKIPQALIVGIFSTLGTAGILFACFIFSLRTVP